MRNKERYNEYQKQYQLARYHRRRTAAILALGGKCSVCGSNEKLELDHRDPEDKSFDVSKLWSVSEARFLAELSKCQVLCSKHHLRKTMAENRERRPVTHGKLWAATKYKCRCDQCIDFLSKYNEQRRAKRRSS